MLAVDPSSPFSGGALLGDRVRMQDHAGDGGVYIRSMASRGHLGGLASAAAQALRVLDAAGCDLVFIETVGVGQSEVEVAGLADTTLVLLAPGMGDGIQAAKAGILEVADLFVVNKADRDGADQTVRDLRYMLSLGGRHSEPGHWRPPICKTVASRDADNGIEEVLAKVEEHRPGWSPPARASAAVSERAAREIEAIALARSGSAWATCTARPRWARSPVRSSPASPTPSGPLTSCSPSSNRQVGRRPARMRAVNGETGRRRRRSGTERAGRRPAAGRGRTAGPGRGGGERPGGGCAPRS